MSAIPPVAQKRDGEPRPVGALTVRERQVARLVAGGSTNRQIGQALGIAEKTTEAPMLAWLSPPRKCARSARAKRRSRSLMPPTFMMAPVRKK